MKNVVLITEKPFWREGSGPWMRTYSLCRYLSLHTRLTILYVGALVTPADLERIGSINAVFVSIPREDGAKSQDIFRVILRVVGRHLAEGNFAACIVDRLHNSWVLPLIQEETLSILDTLDLI